MKHVGLERGGGFGIKLGGRWRGVKGCTVCDKEIDDFLDNAEPAMRHELGGLRLIGVVNEGRETCINACEINEVRT